MRVISGKYKGMKLQGFDIDGTRPTMDRVKESLFATIQNYLKDSTCLDLFAGSGALGIEALSNGAKECYFVDNNKKVIKILNNNLKDIKDAYIINEDFKNFLNKIDKKFDIIFLDPPYSLNLINETIDLILKNDLLNTHGIIICEYENEKISDQLNLLKEKKYGSKSVKICQK